MDDASAELLAQSLRQAFRNDTADAVDAALGAAGWLDALEAEGTAVIPLLFGEQGAANAASTAIDDLLTAALGLPPDTGTAFVLPSFGRHTPPGHARDGAVQVRGLGTSRMVKAEAAVVVTGDGHGRRAALLDTRRLRIRPVAGIDPRLGLVTVESDAIAETEWPEATPAGWKHCLALGQVALACELIGAARTMLRLAREHALSRIQFGRPISGFQAVRHRLADSLIAIESADAAAAAAMDNLADPVSPLLAGIAKALAGRNARLVARHCQQVLAGVGFTAEHDFHNYFRRVHMLDGLLGDARTLTRELGEDLLRTRRMPAPPPL